MNLENPEIWFLDKIKNQLPLYSLHKKSDDIYHVISYDFDVQDLEILKKNAEEVLLNLGFLIHNKIFIHTDYYVRIASFQIPSKRYKILLELRIRRQQ